MLNRSRRLGAAQRPRPRIRMMGFYDEVLRTLLFIVVVTALFDLAIPRSLVDGRSMEPAFEDADRLVVSRVHYLFGDPERGQVAVFNSMDASEPDVMLIKRIIGLPGDVVRFRETRVYINGIYLDEPYIREACRVSRCPDDEWQLDQDQYFVMGDNRNNSRDSRIFGPVARDHIIGQVMARYWPPARFGFIFGWGYPIDAIN